MVGNHYAWSSDVAPVAEFACLFCLALQDTDAAAHVKLTARLQRVADVHGFSDQFRYRTIRRRNNCNSDDGEA